MTTIDESTGAHAAEAKAADQAAADAAAAAANPALVGVPTFVIGSVALGLYLIGFTGSSTNAAIGMVPILILCTGVGQVIATVWAIRTGAGPVAAIFGIFAGFWLSFSALVLGLGHNWFGDATATGAATAAQETFLLTWLIGIVILTLASLRLPSVFTLLFVLVDLALLLVLLGTAAGSTGLLFGGGIAVFAFTLVGVYLFFDALSQASGGGALPLGKPLIGG
ncbi:acetate uptake transporter family protein [Actinomycetospora endophytica]|uniref:Acetate uptake transporter family protein n=1 Tax=Actinomycetospora endophytica TaxID=2291215 RepID=A0ABS8P2J8_9PSEU|nr:GPR1/FUN34/YaaH family transporter [Actinomycetospora endophytica]MCD2192453.1 acetate uptake transporter family protein [Actinomycetospora endophytica]